MKVFKTLIIIFFILLAVIILSAIELYFIKLPSSDITTKLLFIGFLTVNIIALLTLIFFVARHLFKLYMERQQKILGYKFKTMMMFIFMILTLIPSAFLFITASGLATNYINNLFSPQMKRPFDKSIQLAKAFYDIQKENALRIAKKASLKEDIKDLENVKIQRYTEIPKDSSDLIKEGFSGKEGSEVISSDKGDVIKAVVPINGGRKGIIVVEITIPEIISKRTEEIKELYEDYLKLESFKSPIKLSYIMTLGFFTLLIVFAGLWVSFKISNSISIPIQSLALATQRVARGELDVQITDKSSNEIGLLISSFNQMVRQLKESKEALQNAYMESDRRRLYLENILENINSGIIFLDKEGTIQSLNKAACLILNINYEDVVGKNYKDFIKSLNSEDLHSMTDDIEGQPIKGIKRDIKMNINGQIKSVMVYITGIWDKYTERAIGILVVIDDITDIVNAQKVLTWREIARRLAHEIKNPLTPIKLSTERLIKKWQQKDDDFDLIFEKATKTIISEVESLKNLVDVFSRYGKMPEVKMTPTDIKTLVSDVTTLYKGFSGITLNVHFFNNIPKLMLDGDQIKRVLINLIDNAIKAMDGKGDIDINVFLKDDKLILEISDTGLGIPDKEKEKLFIPYFSKTKNGTGLGLAIANKIISDHKGCIIVRDNNPKGSIFRIEIPAIIS
jgi:two-component system nitrogen regulation sensor histidine kinase NtrY